MGRVTVNPIACFAPLSGLQVLGSIGVQLPELTASAKEKQVNVAMLPTAAPSWSSMQPGSAGPAAQVYQPSALQPPAAAAAATTPTEVRLTKAEMKRVCHRCFLLDNRTLQV